MSIKKQPNLWFIFIFVISSGLLLITLPTPVTEAGAELPDRNTPTPVRSSEPSEGDDRDKDSGPVGAYIELQARNASAGDWSVVQWQDSAGGWHDVESWQGMLDNGYRRWWVASKVFDTGPFRWVVYRSPDDPIIATSVPFNLPAEAKQTVRVEVLVK